MSVTVAKRVMKMFPKYPRFSEQEIGELAEVFQHDVFQAASPEEKKEIMLKSSEAKYRSERDYPWDHYFGLELRPWLQAKDVLDLGCFTGGRGVAWCERYGFASLTGIDVLPVFIDAAQQFAARKRIPAEYHLAKGEELPFADRSFDAILSFDVFEHVQNVEATLAECYRVLREGGYLFVVFPSYFHPMEHHLSLATRLPGIHYVFSSRTLVQAYYDVIEERGVADRWYQRRSPHLESWERGNQINGTTERAFKRLIRHGGWQVKHQSHKPIGSIGRNVSRHFGYTIVSKVFAPLTHLPLVKECFLHRITYILERPV